MFRVEIVEREREIVERFPFSFCRRPRCAPEGSLSRRTARRDSEDTDDRSTSGVWAVWSSRWSVFSFDCDPLCFFDTSFDGSICILVCVKSTRERVDFI